MSVYLTNSYPRTYIEKGSQTTLSGKRFNHFSCISLEVELDWIKIYEDSAYIVDNVAICIEIHPYLFAVCKRNISIA